MQIKALPQRHQRTQRTWSFFVPWCLRGGFLAEACGDLQSPPTRQAFKSRSRIYQGRCAKRKVAGGRLIMEPARGRDVCSIKRAFDVSIESAQIERRRSWTAAS